jgi:hypothetical protein
VFLVLMVVGLAGLVMMALPAFGRHSAGHALRGHGAGVARGGGRLLGGARNAVAARGAAHPSSAMAGANNPGKAMIPPDVRPTSLLRFVPSPRAVCSVLALYGAFGNAFVHAGHTSFLVAALGAAVPALLIEWFVVRPVWNLVFRFEGRECSPLEELILSEAQAVVPFRNGRGLVSTVRDGRSVQLAARLVEQDATAPVKVGARLRIEDVDARRERVTVSILKD